MVVMRVMPSYTAPALIVSCFSEPVVSVCDVWFDSEYSYCIVKQRRENWTGVAYQADRSYRMPSACERDGIVQLHLGSGSRCIAQIQVFGSSHQLVRHQLGQSLELACFGLSKRGIGVVDNRLPALDCFLNLLYLGLGRADQLCIRTSLSLIAGQLSLSCSEVGLQGGNLWDSFKSVLT